MASNPGGSRNVAGKRSLAVGSGGGDKTMDRNMWASTSISGRTQHGRSWILHAALLVAILMGYAPVARPGASSAVAMKGVCLRRLAVAGRLSSRAAGQLL